MDEILTYYSASRPTFFSMLSFATDSINAGNYAYFIIVWFWSKIFSPSIVSLRLFSSLGVAVGAILLFVSLKKIYGEKSATLATLITFAFSTIIMFQNSEARFYGLLIALTCLLFFISIKYEEEKKPNKFIIIQLFLINGLLPLVHFFGFAYSLLFTLSVFLSDLIHKRLRWWYYFYSFAGWVLFLPFIPAFKKTLELSKPHFWILKPNIDTLINLYASEKSMYYVLLSTGLFFVLLKIYFKYKVETKTRGEGLALIISVLSISFPIVIYFYSLYFQSMFLDRYMLIFILGFCIISSSFFSRVIPQVHPNFYSKIIYSTFVAIFVCMPVYLGIKEIKTNVSLIPPAYDNPLPIGLPVVTDSPPHYLPRFYYGSTQREYYFVLDWEVALLPHSTLNATQDFKAMQNLKKQIPIQNIMYTKDFLDTFSDFVVMSSPGHFWFDTRIKNNSIYEYNQLFPDIYLVHKKI
ncbi:MAG: hypothetical protein RLZZ517_682 [Candidatus Parcubacteria bacterium]|jgi:MFS family permease